VIIGMLNRYEAIYENGEFPSYGWFCHQNV